MSNVQPLPRRQVYPWRTTAILGDGQRITEVLPATDSQQAEERMYRRLPSGAQVMRMAAVRLAPTADDDLPPTVPVPLDPPVPIARSTRRLRALPQAAARPAPASVGTPASRSRQFRALCILGLIGLVVGVLYGCGGGEFEEPEGPPPAPSWDGWMQQQPEGPASAPTTRLIDPPRGNSVL
jgi:hypothetical protein